jgi:hypothetical protein
MLHFAVVVQISHFSIIFFTRFLNAILWGFHRIFRRTAPLFGHSSGGFLPD